MSQTDPRKTPPTPPTGPASPEPPPNASGTDAGATRRRRGIFDVFKQIRAAGREVASVALGKLIDPSQTLDETAELPEPPTGTEEQRNWRISMMHAAAERLRGAADSYIAAKLDEIEARVDAKLDHVEARIDTKIVELHRQLREMRDRELRHRLRLLKITLIFTVVVALLSLGYKWLAKYLAG